MREIELSVNGVKFNDFDKLCAEKDSLKAMVGKVTDCIIDSDGYEIKNGVHTCYRLVLESNKTWGYIKGVFKSEFIKNPDWEALGKELDEICGLNLLRVFKCKNEEFSEKIYENTGIIRLLQDDKLVHTDYDGEIFINILTDTRLYEKDFAKKFSEFLNKYFVTFDGKPLENINNFLNMSADKNKYSFGKLIKSGCCSCNGSPDGYSVLQMLCSSFNKLGINYEMSRVFYSNKKALGTVELFLPEKRIVVHCYGLLQREIATRKKLDCVLLSSGYNVITYEANTCLFGEKDNNTIKAIIDLVKNW